MIVTASGVWRIAGWHLKPRLSRRRWRRCGGATLHALDSDSKDHLAQLPGVAGVPPIIVHRLTMQIIDGERRVTAALLRHQDTIAVQFFVGTADESFVLAVVANNTTHGLPLSRQDRKAAAERILGMYPDWSDRMVASTVGLSHPTVAVIRRKLSTGKNFQLTSRRGRDGKLRPAIPSMRGRATRNPLPANHDAAAQEGDRHTDGRADLAREVQPRVAPSVEPLSPSTCEAVSDSRVARGYVALKRLWADPALHTDNGRALIKLLWSSLRLVSTALALSAGAPEHCLDHVADAEFAIGDAWTHLAHDLQKERQLRVSATPLTDNGSRRRAGQ